MPLLTCLIAAAIVGQQPPPKETKTFSNPLTGVQLEYPKSWSFRKERLYSKLTFPLSNGKKAEVQLLSSNFRQSAQQWQDIQIEINTSVRRLVERQWEEVILGVPLLMTKLNYKEGDQELTTLVGLLYTRTPEKLNFRLTADKANFEEAEAAWREVLNSLRTISGNLPAVEDPAASGETRIVDTPPPDPDKIFILKPDEPGTKQNLKGLRKSMITAMGSPMELWMPKSWEAEATETRFLLKNKDLKGTASFEAVPGGADVADQGVLRLLNDSMSRFTTISLRKESKPIGSKAGCAVIRAERHGTEGESPLITVYAAGVRNGQHWLLSYEVKNLEDWKRDADNLKQLLDGMVIQAPNP